MSGTSTRAHYWHDSAPHDELDRPVFEPVQLRWAKTPWKGRLGRYVAIRLNGTSADVGIAAAPRVQWAALERALTPLELERWLESGF